MKNTVKNLTKKIFLIILGLISTIIVAISGDMIKETKNITDLETIIYPFLLLCSVIYLHWLFQHFLTPLKTLNAEIKSLIKEQVSVKIRNSAISLGYFCVVLYLFAYFLLSVRPDTAKPPTNFVYVGLFSIGIGILEKTRAVVKVLIQKLSNITSSIEQASPQNADKLRL